MSDIEQRIRERAYLLWEQAGRPEGRGEAFWFAAQADLAGEAEGASPQGVLMPPVEEPPVVAAQHGVPTGLPGERLAEAGVLDDRLAEMVVPVLADAEDE